MEVPKFGAGSPEQGEQQGASAWCGISLAPSPKTSRYLTGTRCSDVAELITVTLLPPEPCPGEAPSRGDTAPAKHGVETCSKNEAEVSLAPRGGTADFVSK